jgi:hypothetical protein
MMAISEPTAHGIPEGARPAGTAASSIAPTVAAVELDGQEPPLVDLAVLKGLEDQLGRAQMARDFAEDYSELWGQRERCLVESLQSGDRTAALDAVISLKVSSAMVGGLRLVRLAEALEGAVRKGDLHFGGSVAALIYVHGPATVMELQRRYLGKAGTLGAVAGVGGHVERPELWGSASR